MVELSPFRSGQALPRRPRSWRERTVGRSARRSLRVIDEVLGELEDLHEKGRCLGRQRACQEFVAGLVRRLGEVPPEHVRGARTSYALHAALLDWQSALLDRMIPGRRELFPDLQERDEWPVPRLRRVARRGARRRGLRGVA